MVAAKAVRLPEAPVKENYAAQQKQAGQEILHQFVFWCVQFKDEVNGHYEKAGKTKSEALGLIRA